MASASVAKSLRSSAFRPPAPRTSIPTPKQQRQQSLLSRSCSQRAAAAATTTTARKTLLPTFLSGDFGRGSCRGFASYREKKEAQAGKIEQLPEVKRLRELREAIASGSLGAPSVAAPTYKEVGLSKEDVDLAMDAAFATFFTPRPVAGIQLRRGGLLHHWTLRRGNVGWRRFGTPTERPERPSLPACEHLIGTCFAARQGHGSGAAGQGARVLCLHIGSRWGRASLLGRRLPQRLLGHVYFGLPVVPSSW
mmetsp:Transcript_9393/g.20381  ORF Transcript_9393/g.20381 Transcript_9393/m.20381 type:complete len:251 (+) Transcript_9393:174-926(+)